MKLKTFTFLILIIFSNLCFSQETKIDSLISISKSQEGKKLQQTYITIADELSFSDSSQSISYFNKALEIAENLGDITSKIQINNTISRLYFDHGDFNKSINLSTKTVLFSKNISDTVLIITSLNMLGNAFNFKGEIDKAITCHYEALTLAEKINNPSLIIPSLNSLGVAYKANNDLENSSIYWEKALEYTNQTDDLRKIAIVYNNLGTNYRDLEEYNKAIGYFEKALKNFKKINYVRAISIVNRNIGRIFESKKNYLKAISYYEESVKNSYENNLLVDLSMYYNDIANTYYNYGDFEKAFNFAQKGLNYALKYTSVEDYHNAYQILRLIETKRGNYKQAIEYYNNEIVFKDSLFNERKSQQINELEAKYETEKKEHEIEKLTAQNILQKQQKYFALSGIIVLLIVLAMAGNRMKLRRKLFKQKEEKLKAEAKYKEEEALRKEEELKATAEINKLNADKVQEELEFKNREITSSALYVAQKNEILSTIDEKLADLKDHIKAEGKKEITQLKRLIKDNIELDDDWNNFKLHFEKVHPRFFESLSEKFPELTANEQKICAYIRMNLSGKEIARLMNITPKSTQMSRYRLKKKFELGADDDLQEFIKNI